MVSLEEAIKQLADAHDGGMHTCELRMRKLGKDIAECRVDQEGVQSDVKLSKLALKQRRDTMLTEVYDYREDLRKANEKANQAAAAHAKMLL